MDQGASRVKSWRHVGGRFIDTRFDVGDGKQFRPVYQTEAGPWAIGDPPGLIPLYCACGDDVPREWLS